jgi:hemolysin activation/secretion protein
MNRSLFLACLGLFHLSSPVAAQSLNTSYQQFAPKDPYAPVNPATTQAQPEVSQKGNPSDLLCPKVRALVFVGRPENVAVHGLRVHVPVLVKTWVPDEPDFRALVRPYVGHPLTRGKLNELITHIILFHRAHDYPIVDVIVPQQDIDNGVIQVLLLESKVGRVTVTGNRWFPDWQIRDDFAAKSKGAILSSRMMSDLDWVNQNPFHSSNIVYQPGEKIGTTDIEIQTKDRFPARFYVGYEDTGNAETGFERYLAGVNWGNAFNLGHRRRPKPPCPFRQLHHPAAVAPQSHLLRQLCGNQRHVTAPHRTYWPQLSDQRALHHSVAADRPLQAQFQRGVRL